MNALREVLRGSLGKSLRALTPVDRLDAAWTVVCGPALAGRGSVASFEDGTLYVEVEDGPWLSQLRSMSHTLARQLTQSAGVSVRSIEFGAKRRSREL